jgi:hypothetical protein
MIPMARKEKPSTDQPQLDPETISTLLDMAAWWQEHKDKMLMPLPLARPRFRRTKGGTTRSIRLEQAMIDKAIAKARKDPDRTGGTFNTLVEVLLWEYLGRPKDLVEPESTPEDQ